MSYQYYEVPDHASVYNKFRPSTPKEIAEKIVTYLKQKVTNLDLAIDVGCGSGQSTEVLAPYFKSILGIDPSETQISEAQKNNSIPNIAYRVGSAEKITCQSGSVQLVTAGQSCHWFDMKKFYAEVERLLVPGGVLAIYGYFLPRPHFPGKSEDLCNVVDKFYSEVLGKYVLPESKKVYIDNYKGGDFMHFPFTKQPVIRDESVTTEIDATVSDLVGYVNSWSAFQNYVKLEGKPQGTLILQKFEKEVMDILKVTSEPAETKITIKYKYFLIMGRK